MGTAYDQEIRQQSKRVGLNRKLINFSHEVREMADIAPQRSFQQLHSPLRILLRI